MKAIDTEFDGYRFRSRLEARWAVFFKTLGIRYEYEKEGYDLDGLYYLPDFYLPHYSSWIEIKPDYPSKKDREKAVRLSLAAQQRVFIFFNLPGEYPGLGFAPFRPPFCSEISFVQKRLQGQSHVHWISSEEYTTSSGGGDFDLKLFWTSSVYWATCSGCEATKIIDLCSPTALMPFGTCPPSCPEKVEVTDPVSPQITAAYLAAKQARFEHRIKYTPKNRDIHQ